MPRYFLEVSYDGTNYSGFQVQKNANSVQAELEKAMEIYLRSRVELTGSSRTDAGVHALQNFFHFDYAGEIRDEQLYNINAILPGDIVARHIYLVSDTAHCRFDAVSREYRYYIYRSKDPFLQNRAYYFPYTLNLENLQSAAAIVMQYHDFTSFSKRNSQVKSYICNILESEWIVEGGCTVYRVRANRFLRGMVRGLVGTMLQVGRGKISVEQFERIVQGLNAAKADFSAPAHGLFLVKVEYPIQ